MQWSLINNVITFCALFFIVHNISSDEKCKKRDKNKGKKKLITDYF